MGFGHKENVYQKSLEEEFDQQKLKYKSEVNLTVFYKDKKVGYYRPDFIIDDSIIIELKSVEFMPKTFKTQLIYYLKSTKFKLGLLINFGAPKLQIKRLIWSA